MGEFSPDASPTVGGIYERGATGATGPQGPPGEQGPPGPAGSGEGGGTVGYAQTFTAQASWVVNHNFGRHPYSWAVETLGGVEIDAAVHHITLNQSVVYFDTPVAGIVRFT